MKLLGEWNVDPSDKGAIAELGDVTMVFGDGGELTYTIHTPTKRQIMLMRYRVDGDVIMSQQPSAPREERTRFSIADDGILTLEFGGTPYRFRRATPGVVQ